MNKEHDPWNAKPGVRFTCRKAAELESIRSFFKSGCIYEIVYTTPRSGGDKYEDVCIIKSLSGTGDLRETDYNDDIQIHGWEYLKKLIECKFVTLIL